MEAQEMGNIQTIQILIFWSKNELEKNYFLSCQVWERKEYSLRRHYFYTCFLTMKTKSKLAEVALISSRLLEPLVP